MIAISSEGGLKQAKNLVTGEVNIIDTMLRKTFPGKIRIMKDHHKLIVYWIVMKNKSSELTRLD